MKAEQDALLGVNAELAHEIGKPARAFGELGIAATPVIVDKGCLCAASGIEVSLDQVDRGVISDRAFATHPLSSRPATVEIDREAIIFLACSGQAAAVFLIPPRSGMNTSAASASGCARSGRAAG